MGDESGILWALGLVSAAIFAWLGKITHMLTNLAERYVPRTEINRRFDKVADEFHDNLKSIDARAEKRADSMETKLDRIIDKLDGKADK